MNKEKRLYFISSPMSSGNRMMIRTIQSCKNFGLGSMFYSRKDSFHYYTKWTNLDRILDPNTLLEDIYKAPNQLVVGISVPRGSNSFIKFSKILNIFNLNDYFIYPIVMHRDIRYVIKSQLNKQHASNKNVARNNIINGYEVIFYETARSGFIPFLIKYEHFVTNKNYRNNILKHFLDLPSSPNMEYYNANDKY